MDIAADPIAQPQRASAIPQTLIIAQGHQDHRRRRARVQNVRIPFGARDRGSESWYRQLDRRPRDRLYGRLRARRRGRRMPTLVTDVTGVR